MTDLVELSHDNQGESEIEKNSELEASCSTLKVERSCAVKLKELSLGLHVHDAEKIDREGESQDGDFTPKAECPPDISEENWLIESHAHGSIDLDDKFDTMTGSYSEIFEDCFKKGKSNEETEVERWSEKNRDDTLIDGALAALNSSNQETFPLGLSCMNRSSDMDQSERYACGLPNLLYGPQASHGGMYPQPFLVDPDVLTDLEVHARGVASSMDTLTENLTEILHGISALTVDCVETYRNSVCKTCDAVDSNIKSMYQLMAKCEELSKAMKPVYKLHEQIKEIRRLLDLFENAVYSGGT